MTKRGLTAASAQQITASEFLNDDEIDLHHDYEVWLEKLAPHAPIDQYRHNRTGEDNADAHLKRQVMGRAGSLGHRSRTDPIRRRLLRNSAG